MILDQVYMPYLFKKEKFYAWQRLVQIQKGMQIAFVNSNWLYKNMVRAIKNN